MASKQAQRLFELFPGRASSFALGYVKDEGTEVRVAYRPSNRPLTEDDLDAHIEGREVIGIYPLREDSHVKFASIDLDQQDQGLIEQVRASAIGLGFPLEATMIVDSGRKGFHLHFFFAEWLPGARAQAFLKAVLAAAGVSSDSVECFPKQAALTEHQPIGNLIKLPLATHPLTKRRAAILGVQRIVPAATEIIEEIAGPEAVLPVSEPPAPRLSVVQGSGGVGRGQRNLYLTKEAGRLRGLGMVEAEIEAALFARNHTDLSEPLADQEVRTIARSIGTKPAGEGFGAMPAPEAKPPKADFFSEQGFVPPRLGAFLHSECPIWPGPDGRLYRYVNGVYRGDGDTWAKERIHDLMGEKFRRRHQDEVMAWLRSGPALSVRPDPAEINLSNGLLNWRTGELRPHSPDSAGIIRVPVRWEPSAQCPRFEQFLNEVLPEDTLEFIFEIIGYGLLPANPMQRAVLLLGSGGNGKGTLLHAIRMLYGVENVSNRTLHDLSDDRFAKADLYGRLANICGDLDARTVEHSDTFKMVTGGDAITAERKYGAAFTFIPFALLLFSANQAPPSSDQSQAYFDRWLIIPMNKRFRKTELEDSSLAAKLTSADEMEGMLQLAVTGLRRLMARGHFQTPESVLQAGEQHRSELDSVLAFAADRLSLEPREWLTRTALYEAYGTWCVANGRRPLNSRNVYAKVLEHFPFVAESGRNGVRGFSGLAKVAEVAGVAGFPIPPPYESKAIEGGVGKPATSATPATFASNGSIREIIGLVNEDA